MNYRKLLEILVGSMQIEVADLNLAKGTWHDFVLKQIEAWASVIIFANISVKPRKLVESEEAVFSANGCSISDCLNRYSGVWGR